MQNQHRGLFRRGRLQKIRPFALTNAAIAKLKHPHMIENNTWRESDGAAEKMNIKFKNLHSL